MPILAVIKNLLGVTSEEEKERERQRLQAEAESKRIEAARLQEAKKQEALADQLRKDRERQGDPISRLRGVPLPEPQRAVAPDNIERDPIKMEHQPTGLQRPPDVQMPGGPVFGGGGRRPQQIPQTPAPAAESQPAQQQSPQPQLRPSSQPDYAEEVLAMTARLDAEADEAKAKKTPDIVEQDQPKRGITEDEFLAKLRRDSRISKAREAREVVADALNKQLEDSLIRRQLERESGRKLRITDES